MQGVMGRLMVRVIERVINRVIKRMMVRSIFNRIDEYHFSLVVTLAVELEYSC